jgi:purine nucleosidase/pyrimidine-specific ribonucleoside hydrolase
VVTQAAVETPAPLLHVIFDDDGSPDGTTALAYLIADPAVWIDAAVVTHGEAHPQVYIQHIGRLLESLGITDIPLGAGLDEPLESSEDFPEWLRSASDNFWGLSIPLADHTYPTQGGAELMIATLNAAPEPLTVFVSGACTDLAQALRLDPGIADKIAGVYIMGGAVYVPGNLSDLVENPTNTAAEWNIYADPVAAAEVLAAGIPVYLVPLDATNQVRVGMTDTAQWRTGGAVGTFAADMYDMMFGGNPDATMAIWDVMTAEIMVHPELCPFEAMHVDVVTTSGDSFGQTVVDNSQPANVNVCLQPDVEAVVRVLREAFAAGG